MNVYFAIKIFVPSIKIYPNITLCVFTRLLQMNNFMYTVMNADIPVIYIGVGIHFYVKFVIRHSVRRAI